MNERDVIRLQRAMREVHVRFARDSEGAAIAQMVHSSHEQVPNVGWTKIYPSWAVAEKDGELIGCVQVCHGVPIGRIEFLSFAPNLPFRTRALAVKALLGIACLSLSKNGSTMVAGTLAFDQNKAFKDILKKNGCKVGLSGNVFLRAAA